MRKIEILLKIKDAFKFKVDVKKIIYRIDIFIVMFIKSDMHCEYYL